MSSVSSWDDVIRANKCMRTNTTGTIVGHSMSVDHSPERSSPTQLSKDLCENLSAGSVAAENANSLVSAVGLLGEEYLRSLLKDSPLLQQAPTQASNYAACTCGQCQDGIASRPLDYDTPLKTGMPSNLRDPIISPTNGSMDHDARNPSIKSADKPRIRARRGQASDKHSILERARRMRIIEKMKALQKLVPHSSKTNKAATLDEIIQYVSFLKLRLKSACLRKFEDGNLPLSTLEGGGSLLETVLNPLQDSAAEAERQLIRLLDTDPNEAVKFLESQGLCLVPINAHALFGAASHDQLPEHEDPRGRSSGDDEHQGEYEEWMDYID